MRKQLLLSLSLLAASSVAVHGMETYSTAFNANQIQLNFQSLAATDLIGVEYTNETKNIRTTICKKSNSIFSSALIALLNNTNLTNRLKRALSLDSLNGAEYAKAVTLVANTLEIARNNDLDDIYTEATTRILLHQDAIINAVLENINLKNLKEVKDSKGKSRKANILGTLDPQPGRGLKQALEECFTNFSTLESEFTAHTVLDKVFAKLVVNSLTPSESNKEGYPELVERLEKINFAQPNNGDYEANTPTAPIGFNFNQNPAQQAVPFSTAFSGENKSEFAQQNMKDTEGYLGSVDQDGQGDQALLETNNAFGGNYDIKQSGRDQRSISHHSQSANTTEKVIQSGLSNFSDVLVTGKSSDKLATKNSISHTQGGERNKAFTKITGESSGNNIGVIQSSENGFSAIHYDNQTN